VSITLIIPSYLQTYTDNLETVEVAGNTTGECFNSLVNKYPEIKKMLFNEDGKLHSYIGIYINKEDVSSGGLSSPVRDGDTVHITYTIGGG
jgi:molybdopterin converting factor small subunit